MMAPSKILAIKLRSMGDTVLLTAPLIELHKLYPQAAIHVLVTQNWESLIQGLPGVQRVWSFERRKTAVARSRFFARLAYSLRKENFDCVVNFHASPSSSLLAFATGSPLRSIHFHGHRHKNRYSTVTIPGKGTLKPIIERDMDTLRALGLSIPEGRIPLVALQSSEKQKAVEYLAKLNLPAPVLGLGLGASRPTKSWPTERFAALAVEWQLKTGGGAIALAGPNEDLLIQKFLLETDALTERSPIRLVITGTSQLPVRELAAVISQLAVLAGNDSGPRHLGVAVGIPTVTLFGPEDPFEWHPYDSEQHPFFFIESLPCRKDAHPGMPPWCGLEVCTVENHKCMRQIGVESVLLTCVHLARKLGYK